MKITLIAAMTADGFIGRTSDHLATEWTNEEDKYLFTEYVRSANNMVMGLNTFKTTAQKFPGVFNKSMPGRRLMVYTEDPSEVMSYQNVEAVSEPVSQLTARLQAEGVETLAVCGGSQIYTMFMEAGLIDDMYVDIQATVFGSGVPLFCRPFEQSIEMVETKQIGPNNLLIHYRVLR